MAVCSPFEPDEFKNENQYTNVEYSGDGKSLTIYLDGSAPVPVNRALTKSLAVLGHDFFEATFVYRSGSGNTVNDFIVARGSWELGEPAGINGIFRNSGGVSYGSTSNTNALSIPTTPGSGVAVLFAGKKTDKTLLAVGALSAVDGNASSRTITNNTKSVSFELNALKAGASSTTANSSILTNASATLYNAPMDTSVTVIRNTGIRSRTFPMYTIPLNRAASPHTTRMRYTLNVHANVSGYSPPAGSETVGGNHFDYYINTIRYAPNPPTWTGAGDQAGKPVPVYYSYRPSSASLYDNYKTPPCVFYKVFNIEPHYTDTTGTAQTAVMPLSWHTNGITSTNPAGTAVKFDDNYTMTPGNVFVNPILFELNPVGGADNKIFSFAFQIPVYALSDQGNPVTWFIRPGYDKYFEELDDGVGGNGGAILVGIGNITASDAKRLVITKVPKIHYNPMNPDPDTGYIFDVTNLEVQYFEGGLSWQIIPPTNNPKIEYLISVNSTATPYAINPFGNVRLDQLSPSVPPDRRDKIIVRYYPNYPDKSVYFDDEYFINVTATGIDVGELQDNKRVVVAAANSWTQFANMIHNSPPQGVGTYLVVFAASFDIPDTTVNINGDITLVLTANMPNITVGRVPPAYGGSAASITFNGNGNVDIYMGTWPSDVPVMAGGDVLSDFPFSVNANGSYLTYPNGTPGRKMFIKGNTTGPGNNFSVSAGPDIRVSNNGNGNSTGDDKSNLF